MTLEIEEGYSNTKFTKKEKEMVEFEEEGSKKKDKQITRHLIENFIQEIP